MLMSKSRLEKFLYALYSLDSSDLPKPLSRIEELYSCLVTGEGVPFFEPLSRVEKYLMAILGGYDVDSLPNPLSRVEVLLYKLATGDDNLDDVKSFLSEHEELLAEIIRNGGVGGNIDIEYVLYTLSTEFNTLYNTAKKPVKSAILKGQTLVNLFDGEKMSLNEPKYYTYSNGIIESTGDGQAWSSKTNMCSAIKPLTKYLLKVKNVGEYALNVQIRTDLSVLLHHQPVSVGQEAIKIVETGEKIDGLYVKVYPQVIGNNLLVQAKVNIIEYQNGMENWDIPYFEGMQSVQMPVLTTTGKNLFDKEKHKLNPNFGAPQTYYGTDYIKVNPLTTYTRNNQTSLAFYTNYGDTTLLLSTSSTTFTTTAETNYIRYNVLKTEIDTHQLEEGSVATPYEPYKSNILTVNEDVVLCGIGDVKDELNLITGGLTQRISEVVLNGSEKWTLSTTKQNTQVFNLTSDPKLVNVKKNTKVLCDKLKTTSGVDEELITLTSSLYIALLKSKVSTIDELKVYLSQNPITFQHQLTTESVKTVDISTVDQDGNDTELSTFNDITHVTLSSEGVIPEAELEVATKNEEDLEDSVVYTAHTLSEEFNTLYNTAEKRVKSAILKGNMLDNVAKIKSATMLVNTQYSLTNVVLKGNTKYIFFFTHGGEVGNTLALQEYKGESGWIVNNKISLSNLTPKQHYIFTTKEETRMLRVQNISSTEFSCDNFMVIEYQDGMENWDIPYFEGMKSVQMPVLTTSNEDGTKSIILTCNEDVTLRSNGNIRDELNLLTGQLTQRIDEDGVVLSQEVVKTVDLSVADQDGNDTKLSTFNDITYVTLSSEGLIPEAELEVAEKVTEVAASMFNISREQEVINITANEQSENTDATMIATTEIYEELL